MIKGWESYEYTKAYSAATAEDLRPVVRKAAKAANQRLVRLEKAGLTTGIYKGVQKVLGKVEKPRFKERTQSLGIYELREEYEQLRSFLTAKGSTVQGVKAADKKRYQKARGMGFKGSQQDFFDAVEKYYSDQVAKIYSSDVIYEAITSNDTIEIDAGIAALDKGMSEGRALLEGIRAKRKKRAKRNAKKSRRKR